MPVPLDSGQDDGLVSPQLLVRVLQGAPPPVDRGQDHARVLLQARARIRQSTPMPAHRGHDNLPIVPEGLARELQGVPALLHRGQHDVRVPLQGLVREPQIEAAPLHRVQDGRLVLRQLLGRFLERVRLQHLALQHVVRSAMLLLGRLVLGDTPLAIHDELVLELDPAATRELKHRRELVGLVPRSHQRSALVPAVPRAEHGHLLRWGLLPAVRPREFHGPRAIHESLLVLTIVAIGEAAPAVSRAERQADQHREAFRGHGAHS
mmetsp:Transcript_88300/g.270216  ORF Transcript_88300/g.270216 Transcript_88300/m.270216 type:complete len:264 (+) Transcript_88300:260-1051(+)